MLALQLEPLYAAEAKKRMSAGGNSSKVGRQNSDNPLRTDQQLAKIAGTSRDTIRAIYGNWRFPSLARRLYAAYLWSCSTGRPERLPASFEMTPFPSSSRPRRPLYADQRIGEILRELPKGSRWKSNSTTVENDTKADALKDAGIATPTAYQLEALAANPEVVQAVIDKAEAEGRIPSRAQVLKAIKERDESRWISDDKGGVI